MKPINPLPAPAAKLSRELETLALNGAVLQKKYETTFESIVKLSTSFNDYLYTWQNISRQMPVQLSKSQKATIEKAALLMTALVTLSTTRMSQYHLKMSVINNLAPAFIADFNLNIDGKPYDEVLQAFLTEWTKRLEGGQWQFTTLQQELHELQLALKDASSQYRQIKN